MSCIAVRDCESGVRSMECIKTNNFQGFSASHDLYVYRILCLIAVERERVK